MKTLFNRDLFAASNYSEQLTAFCVGTITAPGSTFKISNLLNPRLEVRKVYAVVQLDDEETIWREKTLIELIKSIPETERELIACEYLNFGMMAYEAKGENGLALIGIIYVTKI